MRAFVSYRHTGAEADTTTAMLEVVRKVLSKKGIAVSNVFFDVRKGDLPVKSPGELMVEAFGMLSRSDFVLALQLSEERSEGMLMEVGYALAKQRPVVVATRANVRETYLPSMAAYDFRWENLDQLEEKLSQIEFRSLVSG